MRCNGEWEAEAHMWVLRIPDSALDQAGGTGLIERGVLLGEERKKFLVSRGADGAWGSR